MLTCYGYNTLIYVWNVISSVISGLCVYNEESIVRCIGQSEQTQH